MREERLARLAATSRPAAELHRGQVSMRLYRIAP